MANVLIAIVRQIFFVMCGKYVGGFFGLTKSGQKITGPMILTTVSFLIGFPVDLRKNTHLVERMSVLGCNVFLDSILLAVTICVDEDKKMRWIYSLWMVTETGKLCPSMASKTGEVDMDFHHHIGAVRQSVFETDPCTVETAHDQSHCLTVVAGSLHLVDFVFT